MTLDVTILADLALTLLAQAQRPFFEPAWITNNLGRIWDATVEHLWLTGVSVGLGLAISVGLALISLRFRGAYGPIIAFGGMLYTIPSLALFALLRPIVGLGAANAIIALTTYTILILVRNIVTGITEVPEEIVESARGMGYHRMQVLIKVQLPLALPVILAGLRIAAVTVIGLVTVTALLGLGGLGRFILTGFRVLPPYPTQIIVGTILSVVLATVVDLALLGLERVSTPWNRRKAVA